jgi:flavin-dependent dehydrogenase
MLEAGNPQVTAVGPDAAPVRWSARYLVDATGRDTLLANRLGLKRIDKRNNTAALFGHFRNVARRGGDREGMITVHLFEHGWFWVIPLPDEVTSVGLVGTSAFFKARTGSLDAFFAGAVAACPSLAERMMQAERIGPLTACADYSYDTRHCVGARHIMVGDAAAFIDPLFSSGVMMAMSSAVFAAEVVEAALDGEVRTPKLMREYERKIRRSLEALSWLIYRINAPVLRDIFMAPFDLFDTRHGLIAMLAGDFYSQRALLSPLRRVQAVYGCLWVLGKFGLRLGSRGLNWGGGN